MDIRDFIEVPARWRWGGVDGEDCTTRCASYAQLLTGSDPAEAYRGTYSTREGAAALIRTHGGLVSLVGPILAQQGWSRIGTPQSGDLAVIRTLAGFDAEAPILTEVSAVRFGPLWTVFSPNGHVGVAERRALMIACWRWTA